MFELLKTSGRARRGEFTTPHGKVQTPVFMNVGTQGAIKGGLSAADLKSIGCQIELSNTYHLHVRPGDELIHRRGGLHRFMGWDGPMLTDSGGFQIFSLATLRKINEEGVSFSSHVDGRHIFMGPEESMRIQSHLGSDIAMAFDECVGLPAEYDYLKASCGRTYRWLVRCKAELERLNEKLLILQEAAGNGLRPEVTVCCFVPDARKSGGSYREFSGTVKKVDEAARQLVFYGGNGVSDGQRIDIARIRELRSSEYSENEEGEREG